MQKKELKQGRLKANMNSSRGLLYKHFKGREQTQGKAFFFAFSFCPFFFFKYRRQYHREINLNIGIWKIIEL